jgi:hypothetical protein
MNRIHQLYVLIAVLAALLIGAASPRSTFYLFPGQTAQVDCIGGHLWVGEPNGTQVIMGCNKGAP